MTRDAARTYACVLTLLGLALGATGMATPARALSIELKDVAADRINRQRSWADGALPLPGTPNIAILGQRLKEKGVGMNAPMVIRIFKMESELEIWKEKAGVYELFATYPICHWSGSLGPKLREGDKQAPEGFYTVTRKQLYHVGRWPKSLYLDFPNVFDQSQARTGAHILVHGGCTSVGCFAMTNPVMDEIHRLATAAIEGGQSHLPIHIFPFRMTEDNVKAQSKPAWNSFWANLKEAYDIFEKTKKPPRIGACDGRYTITETAGVETGPIEACESTIANIREQHQWLDGVSPVAPVRTAVAAATADAASGAVGGDKASLTDANFNSDDLTDGDSDASAAARPAAAAAEPVAEVKAEPVVRCRFAHKVCRNALTLKGLRGARRAARLASGLRRYMLKPAYQVRADNRSE